MDTLKDLEMEQDLQALADFESVFLSKNNICSTSGNATLEEEEENQKDLLLDNDIVEKEIKGIDHLSKFIQFQIDTQFLHKPSPLYINVNHLTSFIKEQEDPISSPISKRTPTSDISVKKPNPLSFSSLLSNDRLQAYGESGQTSDIPVSNVFKQDLQASGESGQTSDIPVSNVFKQDLQACGESGQTSDIPVSNVFKQELQASGEYGQTSDIPVSNVFKQELQACGESGQTSDIPVSNVFMQKQNYFAFISPSSNGQAGVSMECRQNSSISDSSIVKENPLTFASPLSSKRVTVSEESHQSSSISDASMNTESTQSLSVKRLRSPRMALNSHMPFTMSSLDPSLPITSPARKIFHASTCNLFSIKELPHEASHSGELDTKKSTVTPHKSFLGGEKNSPVLHNKDFHSDELLDSKESHVLDTKESPARDSDDILELMPLNLSLLDDIEENDIKRNVTDKEKINDTKPSLNKYDKADSYTRENDIKRNVTEKEKINDTKLSLNKCDKADSNTRENDIKGNVTEKEKLNDAKPSLDKYDKAKLYTKDEKSSPNKEKLNNDDEHFDDDVVEIKPYMLPFISEDPEENKDIEDPEWSYLRNLETDEERYQQTRKLWKSVVIPDQNVNLTYYGQLRCKRVNRNSAHKKGGVRNMNQNSNGRVSYKRQREEALHRGLPCAKRQRFCDVTFSFDIFERRMKEISEECISQLRSGSLNNFQANKLKSAALEKTDQLQMACLEVDTIHKFYKGLPDQELSVAQEEVEMQQVDVEKIFAGFKNVYGWDGQTFFP